MIASRSEAWWRQFSFVCVLTGLASCSARSSEPTEDREPPGAITGELAVYIADFDDGTTETRYMLRDAAGNEKRLQFVTAPDLEPGTRLHVWGQEADDAIRVVHYDQVPTVDPSPIGS